MFSLQHTEEGHERNLSERQTQLSWVDVVVVRHTLFLSVVHIYVLGNKLLGFRHYSTEIQYHPSVSPTLLSYTSAAEVEGTPSWLSPPVPPFK